MSETSKAPDPNIPPKPDKGHPTPAHVHAAQRDWPAYFDVVAGKPPRETLIAALDAFKKEGMPDSQGANHHPTAIDLGCGEGRDTAELLKQGWSVLAIDGHPDAIKRLKARPNLVHEDRLTIRYAPFEGLCLPKARFINASFCLPFCHPDHFDSLWHTIVDALEPGGRFAGQFFGNRDDWATLPDRSHQTREQAQALLSACTIEMFEEMEDDGNDALQNPKHWHRFDVVAKKRTQIESFHA